MSYGSDTSPLNPVPPVVWLLVLPLAAMEIVLSAGDLGLAGGQTGIGWRADAIQRFALSPMMLDAMVETRTYPADYLLRFVSYPLVHGSFVHALFVLVFLLAIGKMVAEVFRPWGVLAVVVASAVVGGLVYSVVPGLRAALLGGYPPVYGLIGAFTWILWQRLGSVNANRYRAFSLIGFLLGVQLLFGLLFGGSPEWIADLAGFATGFVISFLVGPGGPGALIRAIRSR